MNRPRIIWPRAIGEFVIIVMGVLAALAVDEWRGEYNDRKTEVDYVNRLRVDLERDIDDIFQPDRTIANESRLPPKLARQYDRISIFSESTYLDGGKGVFLVQRFASQRLNHLR